MFIIGEAVIDDAVGRASFACNVNICKGACCCIEGGRGAPLQDDEVLEIERAYPIIKRYLSERSIRTIETSGLYDGSIGNFATTCIDHRECVFVYFDDGIAQCSFERAFNDGVLQWRKPISCHLFPIRIREAGKDFIRYEEIDECVSGRENGALHEVQLHNFLKEPLIRKYGNAWYTMFTEYCRNKLVK